MFRERSSSPQNTPFCLARITPPHCGCCKGRVKFCGDESATTVLQPIIGVGLPSVWVRPLHGILQSSSPQPLYLESIISHQSLYLESIIPHQKKRNAVVHPRRCGVKPNPGRPGASPCPSPGVKAVNDPGQRLTAGWGLEGGRAGRGIQDSFFDQEKEPAHDLP